MEQLNSTYTIDRTVQGDFSDVVDRTTDELAAEGFGVLCDIDPQQKFEEKLGEPFRRYRILGACNPPLAHQALSEELQLGALLPCNVIVYESDDGTVGVSAVDPETMLAVVENPELDSISAEVRERLTDVLDRVATAESDRDT